MKHNAHSGYNIYNTRNPRRRSANDRRKIFVVACLFICMLCVILDLVFISKLLKKGKKDVKPTETTTATSLETDESGNVIVPPDSDVSESTSDATEATSAKTPTVDAATRSANLTALQTKVSDYLGQQNGRFSMYYINMSNGETAEFKPNQPIVAASSIKIAYNTYLYEKAAAGEFSLDDKMAYNAAPYQDGVSGGDYEGGTGNIQNSADGTEFTLREVSHRSITLSDNCGTNMVLRKLGGEDSVNNNYLKTISSVVDYRSKVEYTDYKGNGSSGRRRTSSIDLAKYAEHLYQDYRGNEAHYQPLIDDLCSTEYSWGVPAGIPSSVKVGHKVGFNDSYGTYNDVGIVFASEDYVLCVMTESGDPPKAKEIISEVSKMVYEYVESNYA